MGRRTVVMPARTQEPRQPEALPVAGQRRQLREGFLEGQGAEGQGRQAHRHRRTRIPPEQHLARPSRGRRSQRIARFTVCGDEGDEEAESEASDNYDCHADEEEEVDENGERMIR